MRDSSDDRSAAAVLEWLRIDRMRTRSKERAMTSHSLVPQPPALSLPVAQMRSVFHPGDVERKLARLQEAGSQRDYENLRTVYERMLERGPQRFQVKPSGVPDMAGLYEQLPNFTEVLDDVKRHVALAQDSRDGLEVTPMLLLGPPGIGKTHFARHLAELLGTGMNLVPMSSMTPTRSSWWTRSTRPRATRSTTRWAPSTACWSTTPRRASPMSSPTWPSTRARSSGSPPPTTSAASPIPS
jgi:hypothetical protein